MIKKSHFSVSNPSYVKQSWFLIFTLVSSMGKTHRKRTKVFEKNFISPICKDGQILNWIHHWENENIFFKILKILPTCDSFLKIDFHIELTYGWNPSFFSKNDKILLDSPIGKKDPISIPHPPFSDFKMLSKKAKKKRNTTRVRVMVR